jgi:hypothetical protein
MMALTNRERVWFAFFSTLFGVSLIALGVVIAFWFVRTARGAELDLHKHNLPPMIMCGAAMCNAKGTYTADGEIDKFGRYSSKYYEKRWKRMCKTGARYDAMREANDMGKEQPCK